MTACPHTGHTAPAMSETVTHLSLGFPAVCCRCHEVGYLSAVPCVSQAPSGTGTHRGAAPDSLRQEL